MSYREELVLRRLSRNSQTPILLLYFKACSPMKHKNAFSVTDKQCGIIYRLQGRLQRLMMRLGTLYVRQKT